MKQVKLQYLRRKYEMVQMEEDQKINDYVSKLIPMVNQMKTNTRHYFGPGSL